MRVALILASATLAGAFGGAIAYGVGHMNMAHGLSAWRWLFIIEGAPSCVSAIFVWFILPDYPETASWLSEDEKALAAKRLEVEGSKGGAHAMTWQDAKDVLLDWRLYAHYLVSPLQSVHATQPRKEVGKKGKDSYLTLLETGLLWYLSAILQSFTFHPFNYQRTRVYQSESTAHDSASMGSGVRRNNSCRLVRRLF